MNNSESVGQTIYTETTVRVPECGIVFIYAWYPVHFQTSHVQGL